MITSKDYNMLWASRLILCIYCAVLCVIVTFCTIH